MEGSGTRALDSLVLTDKVTSTAFIVSDSDVVIPEGDMCPGAELIAVIGNGGATAAEIDGEEHIGLEAGTKVYRSGDSVWFVREK